MEENLSSSALECGAKIKALSLPRYSRRGASSRVRMMQYRPFLVDCEIDIEFSSFFSEDYLETLYNQQSTKPHIGPAFLKRLSRLRKSNGADILWIEKEALPWFPWLIERAFLPRVPIVTDYDDAVFHNYDLHRSSIVRATFGRKIDRLMRRSALVMAGNSYLAERATRAGSPWVEIVPTVVDTDRYSVPQRDAGRPLRIGWIGSPSTWREFMVPRMPVLSDIASAEGARLTAVGSGKAAQGHPLLDNLPWSEDSEALRIQEMDIGIMPLTDTPWARGKCGYKLIQYMACGLPVVASPVGVNTEIIEHGKNGFLVETDEEWRDALVTLLRDGHLRQRMGAEGRRKVENLYSLQVWGPKVAEMLKSAAVSSRI